MKWSSVEGIGLSIAALCFVGTAYAEDMARIEFSFGKVEVLRDGAKEWEFVRKGSVLSANDRVRMPPVALLRLSKPDGGTLGLLTGNREASASVLLREAQTRKSAAKLAVSSSERPVVDALPTQNRASETTPAPETALTFSDAELNRWKSDGRSKNPLVKRAAQATLANVQPTRAGIYPTTRLRQAQALYDATSAALEENNELARLFPEKATASLYLLSALCDAAGIPTRRTLNDNKQPLLLIELDIPAGEWKRLTANRNLIATAPSGQASLPLHPTAQTKTLLEAWFASEGLKNSLPNARP